MDKITTLALVLALAAVQSGCGETVVCGDGILAEREICEDGNLVEGDGCSSSCIPEYGWVCADGMTCVTDCGDSIVAGTEVCEQSDEYCRDDCSGTDGECGEGVIQPFEACDPGIAASGPGCTESCQEALGWTCDTAGACDASSVEPTIALGDLEGASLNAFCTWLVGMLGGSGKQHNCGALVWTVNPVSTCETNIAAVTEPTAHCTVAQYESWTAARGGFCEFFESEVAICP